jgi:hypothetical protein
MQAAAVKSNLLFRLAFALLPGVALAQPATTPAPAAQQHYDLNVYPSLSGSDPYALGAPSAQGPIVASSYAPPPAYTFKDVLANSHGFIETGVSSRGGYGVSGGVSMPIVPGKADLDLSAGTGQVTGWGKTPDGKTPRAVYDSYGAGLHFKPTDDTDAYIGISGVRLHNISQNPYGLFGAP